MKYCPACKQTYTDETLKFCRDDGTTLITGSASPADTSATLTLPASRAADAEPTRLLHTETSEAPGTTSALEPRTEAKLQTGELKTRIKAAGAGKAAGGIKRQRVIVFAALAAIVIVAVFSYFYFTRGSTSAIDSIAVMPFVNATADPNTEYLSDGITESIINNLSQLPNFAVISRNSVFRYKGRETDPVTIGHELGVRAVLTGRVIQRGDNLSISVELVDASNNHQLWGEQYNRKSSDLLAVQSEISQAITEKLRLRLTSDEQKRIAKQHTANPQAYQAYLQGRFYLHTVGTEDGNRKALDAFNQAVALDPNYALAYAGLADGYAFISDWAIAPHEAMPKARMAAMKALELDDSLPQAHNSLGVIFYRYDHNWVEAEKEIRRAIELNPRESFPHAMYSDYLYCLGRFDESLREVKIARELDPFTPPFDVPSLLALRQDGQALEHAREWVNSYPDSAYSHMNLGIVYQQAERLDDAVSEFERARQLDDSPFHASNLAYSYAIAGRRAEAQKILDKLLELSKQRYVSPSFIAQIYAGLGDKDQAFSWLDKAFEAHSDYLTYLKFQWSLESLHSDPRFAALVRRAGLPM